MSLLQRISTRLCAFKEPRINFNDGPFVENPHGNPDIDVGFFVGDECRYRTTIAGGEWAKASHKYLANWRIEISGFNGLLTRSHSFDPEGRRIRINIDSRSLGDTLAWIPQIAAFKERHLHCEIYVSTFWEDLNSGFSYPNLNFIPPHEDLEDCYAVFNLGYYFDDLEHRHPTDPRTVPLGQVGSDILGIDYQERRPILVNVDDRRPIRERYVCTATTSTAACKHWLYPGGWQTLVNWLGDQGLRVAVIQKEPTDLEDIVDLTGDAPITDRIAQLQYCEFFIGLGSGLSWLAWALSKPVVLISGFSEPFAEFAQDCVRIINQDVCHGCWNDTNHAFDRGNWNWCPRHGGTNRQFECSREITPQMVIRNTNHLVQQSTLFGKVA